MTDIITSNDFEYEKVSQLRYFRYLKKLELQYITWHHMIWPGKMHQHTWLSLIGL